MATMNTANHRYILNDAAQGLSPRRAKVTTHATAMMLISSSGLVVMEAAAASASAYVHHPKGWSCRGSVGRNITARDAATIRCRPPLPAL